MMIVDMRRFIVLLFVVVVVRAQEIEFDAIVNTDGDRVHFSYNEGTEVLDDVIKKWCAENVAETLANECSLVLHEQVALAQRERATPDVELEVKVDQAGRTEYFRHQQGQDIRAEAALFCKLWVPEDGVEACTHTIATAAMEKATKADTIWGDLFGLMALRGGLGQRGVFDDEQVKTDETLGKAKFVGVLFAADWCQPCKTFLPILTKYYNKIHKRKNFEIIWVSGSRSKDGYDSLLAQMPWLGMVYDMQRSQAIQQAFQVAGFPTFLIFDSKGEIITRDGVQKVTKDPSGLTFPYRTPAQQLKRLGNALLAVPAFLTRPFRRRKPQQ